MNTIKVTLADAPRDVLVYLVSHAAKTPAEIAAAVAPAEAERPLGSVCSALSLLRSIGYADQSAGHRWYATQSGCAAVRAAVGGEQP